MLLHCFLRHGLVVHLTPYSTVIGSILLVVGTIVDRFFLASILLLVRCEQKLITLVHLYTLSPTCSPLTEFVPAKSSAITFISGTLILSTTNKPGDVALANDILSLTDRGRLCYVTGFRDLCQW